MAQVLNVDFKDLLPAEESAPSVYLGKSGRMPFNCNGSPGKDPGFRIQSFFPFRGDLFVGKVFVTAGHRMTKNQIPQSKTLFLQMLLGALRIQINGKSYEITEGDHLLFPGDTSFTIENPSSRDSLALLASVLSTDSKR